MLRAPLDGVVAQRRVQLGQRVQPGMPLMAVVPVHEIYVDANFKEVQLRNIRLGQPAKLTADVYGKKVEYTGTVAGLGVGTGSAFALLPAQNATGNWIKIVQRIPVRIQLDAEELKAHPLRVGMSMIANVNTHQRDGAVLGTVAGSDGLSNLTTNVYAQDEEEANREADKIINANLH